MTRTELFDVVGTDGMGRDASQQTPGQVVGYRVRALDRLPASADRAVTWAVTRAADGRDGRIDTVYASW